MTKYRHCLALVAAACSIPAVAHETISCSQLGRFAENVATLRDAGQTEQRQDQDTYISSPWPVSSAKMQVVTAAYTQRAKGSSPEQFRRDIERECKEGPPQQWLSK